MFLNRILLLLRVYIWNTFSLTIHNMKWFFSHLHPVTNCNASIFLSFLNERESNTFYYTIILNLVEKLWDVLNGNFKQNFFYHSLNMKSSFQCTENWMLLYCHLNVKLQLLLVCCSSMYAVFGCFMDIFFHSCLGFPAPTHWMAQ